MSVERIPVTEAANQAISVVLDGVVYELDLVWNVQGFWSLSVLDLDKNVLISGVKVVLQIDFFKDHPDRGLPPGAIYAVDYSGNESDIGRYDFVNERGVVLLYRSAT